ncbi:cation:proton antiporter [Streptomyces sp. NPDC058611]|uniref:cation:proton antiporter n=1 Tax=unclassified Streptomyces TaxID=2593676 RepID=UPI00364A32D5
MGAADAGPHESRPPCEAARAAAVDDVQGGGFGTALAALVAGLAVAAVLRHLAGTAAAAAGAARFPLLALAVVAAAAGAAAGLTERFGLTDMFGAVLVGLALPADRRADGTPDGPWTRTARRLGRIGRLLLPLLFVTTGATLASGPGAVFSWRALIYALTLAVTAKLAGSYLGARLGGRCHAVALRLAALMNTRGLTEIVVLQVGWTAGILTPALHLDLIVMALTTTALCGPLLGWIDCLAPLPAGRRIGGSSHCGEATELVRGQGEQ